MDEEQAKAEAIKRWGDQGFATKVGGVNHPRFMVGKMGEQPYGVSEISWEDAFVKAKESGR